MTLGISILLIAVGAILKYAVSWEISGIDLQVVGVILMIVGVLGLVITLIVTYTADRDDAKPPPTARL